MDNDDQLRRREAAVWMTIGLIGAALACCALAGRLDIDWRSFLVPVAVTAMLAAGGWLYRSLRKEARLGAILVNTAFITGFSAVAAPLSYVAAAAALPLQDALLNDWDRALGFDWAPMMTFISQHAVLAKILFYAYSSFAPQAVTTVIALAATGQLTRLNRFIAAFVATTLVTIAISAVVPAAGPFLFLDIQPADANGFLPVSATSWPDFFGLRDGTLHTIRGLNCEGIITFPSLHAALGVLFAMALWGVRRLRWIALALNAVMLIATPAYGSHYLVDVIAGVAIAAVCWIIAARKPLAKARPIAAMAASPSIVPEMEQQQVASAREQESAARVAQA
jgi:membrane-associated phospholipid phosphatase